MKNFSGGDAFASGGLLEGFHRDFGPNFITEAEAVHHCFGEVEDVHSDPIDLHFFNTFGEGVSGEVEDLKQCIGTPI